MDKYNRKDVREVVETMHLITLEYEIKRRSAEIENLKLAIHNHSLFVEEAQKELDKRNNAK